MTSLSVIAFNAAKGMSAANCTFNWSTVDIKEGSSVLNAAYTYISYCHDKTTITDIVYTNATTPPADLPLKASTALFSEFLLFDAVNIYYNNTLYFAINATNAASVGFTPSTFFAGTDTKLTWSAVGKTFKDVTLLLVADDTCFSTVKAKLYIAKF